MTRLHGTLILLLAYLAVFCQCTFSVFRQLTLAQFDLLPALVVYASLRLGIVTLALLAICGGLCFDALSANPLGVSVMPLFAVGLVIQRRRELILREQRYAQFVLGALAGALVPLLTLLLLLSLGQEPLLGWGALWQWLVMAAAGGVLTPLVFCLFDWLERLFAYKPAVETSFRMDREIKRGRS